MLCLMCDSVSSFRTPPGGQLMSASESSTPVMCTTTVVIHTSLHTSYVAKRKNNKFSGPVYRVLIYNYRRQSGAVKFVISRAAIRNRSQTRRAFLTATLSRPHVCFSWCFLASPPAIAAAGRGGTHARPVRAGTGCVRTVGYNLRFEVLC